MSTKIKKSWREKLADSKDLPKVSTIEGRMSKCWGEGTFVIPAPVDVNAILRQVVQKGKRYFVRDYDLRLTP